jgi:DNA-binding response OmpR family regulator
MMPGLTTKNILERLRDKKSNTKIILLTVVRFSDREKQRFLERGNVVDFLTKPFEVKDLIRTIHKHLGMEHA